MLGVDVMLSNTTPLRYTQVHPRATPTIFSDRENANAPPEGEARSRCEGDRNSLSLEVCYSLPYERGGVSGLSHRGLLHDTLPRTRSPVIQRDSRAPSTS